MKRIATLLSLCLLWSATASAQKSEAQPCDSIIVVSPDNGRLEYVENKWMPVPSAAAPWKRTLLDMDAVEAAEFLYKKASHKLVLYTRSHPDSINYDFGQITLLQGVSPSGAKTYTVPIECAPDSRRVPSVALYYNSQSGNGIAGYGWNIAGVSKITITNKCWYYDGNAAGADVSDTSSVYALDGVRLVQNANAAYPECQYETANGHILVRKHTDNAGHVLYFTARYPDGSVVQFGSGNHSSFQTEYPVDWSIDKDGNRIDCHYDYDDLNDCHYLRYIQYGYNSMGDPMGAIRFNYSSTDRADTVACYRAGRFHKTAKLLTSVECWNDEALTHTYTLDHDYADNVTFLKGIHCSKGVSELPPLEFSYGYDLASNESPLLQKTDSINVSVSFENDDLRYCRGKFASGIHEDGVLVVPNLPIYDNAVIQFISPYSPTQKFLMVTSTFFGAAAVDTTTFIAGDGFQTIEAVDVDADGQDEVVKVNFGTATSSGTPYTITKYKFNSGTHQYNTSSFNVLLSGRIKQSFWYSPYQRGYYWGDFVGKGKVQLLAIAYSANAFNVSQTCYASLIDIDTGTKLSEEVLFDLPIADAGNILTFDIDGDGKTELCRATSSGLQVYKLSANNQFELVHTVPNLTSASLSEAYDIVDINSDGYPDFMFHPDSFSASWRVFYNNGALGFVEKTVQESLSTPDATNIFIDVNRDGFQDLIADFGTNRPGLFMNKNGVLSLSGSYIEGNVGGIKGFIPGNIVDVGAESAFMRLNGYTLEIYGYNIQSPDLRQMVCAVDSYGSITETEFDDISAGSCYTLDSSYTPSEGFMVKTLPIRVLTREYSWTTKPSVQDFKNVAYDYSSCTLNNWGLGFCGFRKIRSLDWIAGSPAAKETVYSPEQMGLPLGETLRFGEPSSSPVRTVQNTYDSHSTTYGKLNPRLTQSVSYDALTGVRDTTTYIFYDNYDYPLRIIEAKAASDGECHETTVEQFYSHSNTDSLYLLGSVRWRMASYQNDGNGDDIWSEKTETDFDARKHPTKVMRYVGLAVRGPHGPHHGLNINPLPSGDGSVSPQAEQPVNPDLPPGPDPPGPVVGILEPSADELVSDTEYSYDAWGHAVSESTALYGSSEYVGTSCSYGSEGRFMASSTDEFGKTTTYSGYNAFGQPTVTTDWDGRTTLDSYDSWGNPVSQARPDGSSTSVSHAWDTTGPGLYTVTTTGSDGSQKVVRYGALGREVRTSSRRFDGAWSNVDMKYDARGRISRVSLPFTSADPAADTASFWITRTYDTYGRPAAMNEPSGRTTTWTYSGLSTTETREGIARTSTVDASGRLVSVTDAGGTITYALRDDGKPLSVTAPGNAVTTFTYDEYGRRTSITDPSDGTRTWQHYFGDNGRSLVTETNKHGTVDTRTDEHGRVYIVQRSGDFSTSYSYSASGQLFSEVSTNGTSRTYTYDALDRVLEATDSIPDGKWLRTHFNYDSTGVLCSKVFTSQSGSITTEHYSYAYGHRVRVTLPDSTVVWQLDSTNALGQPTQATTGSIVRRYSFTPYGMPTGRTFGPYRTLSYVFDAAKGNLSSRDDTLGDTETFQYDTLGRLVTCSACSGGSYDTYGNIKAIDGIASMQYGDTAHPYDLTSATFTPVNPLAGIPLTVSTTCFDRASHIARGGYGADFTYDGEGDRVRMQVTDSTGTLPVTILTRYYLGERYEIDVNPSGTTECFYLDGTPYSAPMAMVRAGSSGPWTLYSIGRDYLGSVTDVVSADGAYGEHYNYSAWGLMQDPETGVTYGPDHAPDTILGRGFTGHEHLPWFGLVNMNARLYDPAVGRFLSPDPFVQSPDDTRNYNRYSYALNNPLKYTDESGEIAWLLPVIIGAVVGTYVGGVMANYGEYNPIDWNYNAGKTWGYMIGGAVFGGLSGLFGWAVTSSGIPMANTAGLMSASFVNSVGTNIYTGGATPVSISFGLASYDLTNNNWGYLGKKGNKWYENLGYGLGALANISDILMGVRPQEVDLITEHSDGTGHTSIVEKGTINPAKGPGNGNPANADPYGIISVGPNRHIDPYGSWHWMRGTNHWDTHTGPGNIFWRQTINVNKGTIIKYANWLNAKEAAGSLYYSVEISSCVSHVSTALNLSGIFNVGIHPYLLYAQMCLWNNAIRPWSFSYYPHYI